MPSLPSPEHRRLIQVNYDKNKQNTSPILKYLEGKGNKKIFCVGALHRIFFKFNFSLRVKYINL